jgi:O-antigen ligase
MVLLLMSGPWSSLALIIILLTWLGRWQTQGYLTRRTPMDVPLLFLLITALVGYFVAVDPARAYRRLTWIMAQVALLYSLLNCLRTGRDIWRYAQGLVVGTTVFALVSLVGTDWQLAPLLDLPWLYDHIPSLIRGFPSGGLYSHPVSINPRLAGAVLATLLPLSMVMFSSGRSRWDRLLALAALLTGGLVLLLSQAMMGFFGLAMSLLLIVVWWRRWLIWPAIAGPLLLAGAVLIYGPQRWLLPMLDTSNILGLRLVLRLDIWSRALAMIQDMPFTGIGLDNFAVVQPHFYIGHLLGPTQHAHNLLLQTTLDFGILGAVALLWLLLAFLVMLVSAYRTTTSREIQVLLVGLGAGVLAYFAGGLTDVNPIGEIQTTVLWAMLGLAAAAVVVAKGQSAGPDRLWKLASNRWLLAIPAFTLLVGLLLFPSALQRNLSLIPAQQVIYEARTTGNLPMKKAEVAVSRLNRVIASDSHNPELFGLLGSLYAWQGAEEAALCALRERLNLDSEDPLGLYAPFLKWRLQLVGDPIPSPSDGLLRVYQVWRNRFPNRAEAYTLTALVWQEHEENVDRAADLLQSGLDKGANPQELLQVHLGQIESGG